MSASQEELALGEQRETWCAVERMKEEAWCRKQRDHNPRYQQEMASDIFGRHSVPQEIDERCQFPEDKTPKRAQMRHYPKTHNKSQLNL